MNNLAAIDNRARTLKALGMTGNNREDIKKVCSLLRDEQDLVEFLKANHPDMREPIFDALRQELRKQWTYKAGVRKEVRPFWVIMKLPRPDVAELPREDWKYAKRREIQQDRHEKTLL